MTSRATLNEAIPEVEQRPVRERLRMARVVRQRAQDSFKSLSAGVIGRYERIDISTCTLGNLAAYAQELGYSLHEMCDMLFETEDAIAVSQTESRMSLYMQALDADDQEFACDLIQALVDKAHRSTRRALLPYTKTPKPLAD